MKLESFPPSSGAPSPMIEGPWAPFPSGQALKRAYHTTTTTTSVAPKEDEATLQEMSLPSGPSEVIAGPSGTSMLLTVLQGGPPIPCYIPQLALAARSFKGVNLKGSGKMYICGQCKKHTSNWDSMVSYCLQEHLGIHLVCPQHGMSYLDLSEFYLQGKGTNNLLFYLTFITLNILNILKIFQIF